MNICFFLFKIISQPIRSVFPDQTSVVELIVQFIPLRTKTYDELRISIWGNFGIKVMEYYQLNDYILVEGLLSLRDNSSQTLKKKEVELTIIDLQPFFLDDDDVLDDEDF